MRTQGFILTVCILTCMAGSIVSAETASIPDLIGNWTGTSVGHMKEGGYETPLDYNYTLSIEDQTGRAFNGTLYITGPNYKGNTGFSAVIGNDMTSLYMSQYDDGFDFGEIISPNEIELIYAESGKNGMALIESFIREK